MVNSLIVPLAFITPDGVLVDAEVSCVVLQPPDAEGVPVDAVRVNGTLLEAGQDYIFQGTISGRFAHPCDRCLEPAEAPFNVEVVWTFKEGPAVSGPGDGEDEAGRAGPDDFDADEASLCIFDGNEIDLRLEVWSEVVLAVSAKLLCREDCAGLCPQCGANWNYETCACPKTDTIAHKGLSGLADLFPDLGPKRPKE